MTPDLEARIAQFENMAQADPDNEMAHYSLGTAYMQAGNFASAAAAFQRCTEIAPTMSKAFQLAGEAAIKAGQPTQAATILEKGYVIAAQRGDRMPQAAIADLLKSMGREPPKVSGRVPAAGAAGVDLLGGAPAAGAGTKMARPPFKGPLGEWIAANITQERWNAWIGQGTKVINELRLDLSRDNDAEVYDQHMREYLGIDNETLEKIKAG